MIFSVYEISMKPYQEQNHIGFGEGDISESESRALKARLNLMKELSKKRVEGHHEKMRRLVNTHRGDDVLDSQEGGQH